MEQTGLRVKVLPLQPHCFAFGGFEIQMLSALEAVRACGVDTQPMDIWSRDADFDVMHVWGLEVAHTNAVYWARKAGKRIVMTALLPYLSAMRRLRHAASLLVGPGRLRRELLAMVDILVVVNDAQAEAAWRMLGMRRAQVVVIPNSIETQYFEPPLAGSASGMSDDGYVLCTGNVCVRKNQLNLTKACLAAGCHLVIIGDVLPGEEQYAEALARLINGCPTIRWLPGMPAGSPELVGAYRRCRAFALPSHGETQPISLLEAAAAGKPLLLAKRPYALQKYYRNACLVDPCSLESMEWGLREITTNSERYTVPRESLAECHPERVGEAYFRAYRAALGTNTVAAAGAALQHPTPFHK